MRRMIILGLLFIPLLLCGAIQAQDSQDSTAETSNADTADIGWPREIKDTEHTVLVYQPQIESWENNIIIGSSAVSVETQASPQPEYGTINLTAGTEVDKENRIVTITDLKITDASFPGKPEMKTEYLEILNDHLPFGINTISLDRLESNLAITGAADKTQKVDVKNDPPKIIFSSKPAVLILVDGKPALRQVEGTNYLRIINTRALILLDQAIGRYYMSIFNKWASASNLDGPWSLAQDVPSAAENLKETAAKGGQVDLMDQPSDEIKQNLDKGILPEIHVSSVPVELIVTEGEMQFEPINDTQLLYVKNTDAQIFMYTQTQDYYVLISGRWFKSKNLTGTWEFVAGNNLPPDFAKIPETHPKGDILSSIPGTTQAEEAAIANTIPQTAAVKKNEAALNVTYDGKPQFNEITSTALQYAVNSPTPVIKINATTYYAVDNGVWFTAGNPEGPWAVASSVPTVIYTIPASSPLHYVTYVKIYNSTPDVVYVGYTPGYYGSYLTTDNVVVYGTGWYYPPYIGGVWIGAPYTYGFGAGFATGCAFGFAAGFACGTWCHPWWGPYHGWGSWGGWGGNQVNINHLNVYNKWGGNTVINRNNLKNNISNWQGKNVKGFENARNNVFAGRDGHAYRNEGNSWQKYSGNGKWSSFEDKGGRDTEMFKNQAMSRSRGEFRENSFRAGGGFGGGGFRGGGFRGGRR